MTRFLALGAIALLAGCAQLDGLLEAPQITPEGQEALKRELAAQAIARGFTPSAGDCAIARDLLWRHEHKFVVWSPDQLTAITAAHEVCMSLGFTDAPLPSE